jgi:hypothetical protein
MVTADEPDSKMWAFKPSFLSRYRVLIPENPAPTIMTSYSWTTPFVQVSCIYKGTGTISFFVCKVDGVNPQNQQRAAGRLQYLFIYPRRKCTHE